MNAVLLEGDPLTLVDCGPRYPEARQALESGLMSLGYRVEDIEVLVLTHFHVDHAGLAAEVRQRSGCRVLAHPKTNTWLKLGHGPGRADFAARLFADHGGPAPVAGQVAESVQWLWTFTDPLDVDGYLDEGDLLPAGGRIWRVLHTPGHAYGHICLWNREARGMVAGDHLIAHISSNALVDPVDPDSPVLVRSLPLYLQSLQRVAELDLAWLASSHGRVITNHRGLIASRLMRTERRLEQIRHLLKPEPATAYGLMRKLFPNLDRNQLFLGLSEVLGHLFVLEDRGQAAASGRPVTWSLTQS
ncbi:MAG: MBL fold metallo-hydrolase [Firmicutes bacterium]|nr:MBL fold metallo-hydrolase [Bacillota bacterium]